MIDHCRIKLIPYTKKCGFSIFPSFFYSTQCKHQSLQDQLALTREKPCAKCSNWSIYDVIFDQNEILAFICLIMVEASEPWPIWKHDMLVG